MVTINLLSSEQRALTGRPEGSADGKVIGAVGSLVVLVGGLCLFHASQRTRLEALLSQNAQTRAEVDAIRGRVSDHAQVRAELGALRSHEETVEGLRAERVTPTSVLVELSHMLSPAGMPTMTAEGGEPPADLRAPQRPNPAWDPRRLWVTRVDDEARRVVVSGEARSPDDVAEFVRRLRWSAYFADAQLERSEAALDAESGLSTQRFSIRVRARY